jgi:hypothetical protein
VVEGHRALGREPVDDGADQGPTPPAGGEGARARQTALRRPLVRDDVVAVGVEDDVDEADEAEADEAAFPVVIVSAAIERAAKDASRALVRMRSP